MRFKDSVVIKEMESGQRLDKFLVSWAKDQDGLKENFSRGDLIRVIKKGDVRVDDRKAKPSLVLKVGDVVSIDFEKTQKQLIPNENLAVEIVHEDEDIIVINKSAGICVHPSSEREDDALANALIALYPEIIGVGDDSLASYLRPGIVHRLDKDTSGVMVVARNQESFDELKRKFQGREILKKYEAIVYEDVKEDHFVVSDPIARATSYKKQVIAGKKTKTKVREAVTEFRVLEKFERFTLLEAQPKTGRMHQIRVHLHSVGHPIVGDKLYQKKEFSSSKFKTASRQLLHAKELEFELFGKKHKFEVQPPMDFVEFLQSVR